MAHESETDGSSEEVFEDAEFWDAIEGAVTSGDLGKVAWAEQAVLARGQVGRRGSVPASRTAG